MKERFKSLLTKPFSPFPLIAGGHLQTIAASFLPRKLFGSPNTWIKRDILTPDGDIMVAFSALQKHPQNAPDLLLVHGMEGSANSPYMLGMGSKAFIRGFNVHRLNLRGCGDSVLSCKTPYHAGSSEDVMVALEKLQAGFPVFLAGISLGGNIALKLAGESRCSIPVAAVAGISVPIDLEMGARDIDSPQNFIYRRHFLRAFRGSFLSRISCVNFYRKFIPELLKASTLWEFDEKVTAPIHGFKDALDYYRKNSSINYIQGIDIPALLIHARDDPFVTYDMYRRYKKLIDGHRHIVFLDSSSGGHAGFIGRRPFPGDMDIRWAEERVFEFFSMILDSHDNK